MRILIVVCMQFFFVISVFSQTTGSILIVANANAKVVVDGKEIGRIKTNTPGKFEVEQGQHYLQVITIAGQKEKNEILDIISGKQQVLKYEFGGVAKKSVKVADVDLNIPGLLNDQEQVTFMYAFEKGDKILINLAMSNDKGTNKITVFTYPDGNSKYSNDSFQDLKDVRIKVNERSIYGFSFASNHTFDRDAQLKINRVPESEATVDFNTTVSKKDRYAVKVIQKPQKFYINSGSHATFKGGKSRIVIPVNFPPNTVKWYYTFSASRDEAEIDKVTNSISLASELSTLIDQTGLLSFGLSQLSQPPGSDVCDVYILDHENISLFTSKQVFSYFTEGTRENINSGVVELDCCINLPTYIGLKNPDSMQGIHVTVEVAAIVKDQIWVMHHED